MFRTCAERARAARTVIAVAALLALAAPFAAADEGWTPDGVRVASSYADRVWPVAVPDGAGGVYVAWQEWAHIRLQHLTAEGTVAPGWSADQGREVCPRSGYGSYEQSSPRVVPDDAGGVYVLWHDERNSGCRSGCLGEPKQIFLQRFGPDGAVAPGWPALGVSAGSWLSRMGPTPGGERGSPGEMNTVVVPDGRGGLLVAWIEQNLRGNTEPGLRAQRIGPDGARRWGERGVRVCARPGEPEFPAIAADRNGGAIIVWQDLRDHGNGSRIYVQRLNPEGEPVLAANGERATLGPAPNERFPRLSGQGRDGVLLVWEAGADAERRGLFARRLRLPERAALPGPERVARASSPEVRLTDSALPEGEIAILADASDGAWVAWVDVRRTGGRDLYAHRLLRNGRLMPMWPENGAPVATTPCEDRSRPKLVSDGSSGAFVAWRDAADPRVILVTARGEVAAGWPRAGLALTSQTGVDRGLDLIADGRSGAIGVWDQWLAHIGVDDVRAQRVDRVLGLRAPLARLPLARATLAPLAGETAFALDGLRPNPSPGSLAIAFALPSAEAATLEVFDLAGRRVAGREVGDLGAGRHLLRLEPEAPLAPGLYLIRLTQGERRLVTRGVISR